MTPIENWKSETLADRLGQLQAEIGVLKTLEAEIKGELIDRGEDVAGQYYRVVVRDVNRNKVNWRMVAQKLNASRQLITAHTSIDHYSTVTTYEVA